LAQAILAQVSKSVPYTEFHDRLTMLAASRRRALVYYLSVVWTPCQGADTSSLAARCDNAISSSADALVFRRASTSDTASLLQTQLDLADQSGHTDHGGSGLGREAVTDGTAATGNLTVARGAYEDVVASRAQVIAEFGLHGGSDRRGAGTLGKQGDLHTDGDMRASPLLAAALAQTNATQESSQDVLAWIVNRVAERRPRGGRIKDYLDVVIMVWVICFLAWSLHRCRSLLVPPFPHARARTCQ